jgi:NADH-quinone oxidoreductase subunit L
LVFSALLLVLADNFVLLFFGWEGVALGAWGLLGVVQSDASKASSGRRAFVVNRVGDASLLLGIALFYWGFGGAWVDGDYVPDLNARFSSVVVEDSDGSAGSARSASPSSPSPDADRDDEDTERAPAVGTTGEGFLTLTSYLGAAVFMDDARAPLKGEAGQLLRSPFVRLPVRGGFHSFRVHPGSGLDDFLVTHVAFGEGREIALAPLGPTVTFREARDQLALRDTHGAASIRDSLLAKRGPGGVALVAVVSLFLMLAAAIRSARFWSHAEHARLTGTSAGRARVAGLLHAGFPLMVSGYLLARVGFFLALSSPVSTLVGVFGILLAILVVATMVYPQRIARLVERVTTLTDCTFVAAAHWARDFTAELDGRLIGGAVNAVGGVTRAFAWVVGRVDDDVVDGAVRAFSAGVTRAGERMRLAQTGRAQTYVYVIVVGVLALALLQYWLR